MNKKFLIIFIALFIVSVCTIIVSVTRITYSANNPAIVIECDSSSMNPSSSMTCHLRGKNFTTNGVSLIEARLVVSSNLTLSSVTKDGNIINDKNEIWQGEANDTGEVTLYGVTVTGNFDIISFTITSSNITTGYNAKISLTNVEIGNQNFETSSMTVSDTNIRIKSSINTLSTLTVNSNNILTSQTTYELTSSSNTVTIGATKTSETSTMSGDVGTKTLNYGLNTFTITVTSEAGSSKTYTIKITRPDILSFSNKVTTKTDNSTSYFIKYGNTFNEAYNTPSIIRNEITTSGQIAIKNKSNVTISDSDKVGTGSKLTITLSGEVKNYTIVIPGDTNGDGNVNEIDVAKLFQHYRGTTPIPENQQYYLIAGDVVQDNIIKLPDVAKLFQYTRGTIEQLN